MMLNKRKKGSLSTFWFLVTAQIILLLFVVGYSTYMTELNCPQYDALQNQFGSIPFNQTNPATSLTNTWELLSLLFTGCGNIPWWIYIVVFAPMLITIVVYIVPFIGG